MPLHATPDHQILEIIIRSPGIVLDEVVLQCSNLTWNQVFVAVDRLSRAGTVALIPKGHGLYSIYKSDQASLGAQYTAAA